MYNDGWLMCLLQFWFGGGVWGTPCMVRPDTAFGGDNLKTVLFPRCDVALNSQGRLTIAVGFVSLSLSLLAEV